MSEMVQSDPLGKRFLRWGWRCLLGIWAAMFARRPHRAEAVRVFYGGARAGNLGGPKVKVQRLQQFFPESRGGFNLIYSLSNAPYLSAAALKRLKNRRVPIVHNQNGVFYPAWFVGDWKAKNAEMAEAHRLADHVFYQSEFCRLSAEQFLGPREGSSEILYNAIDTTHFMPRQDYMEAGKPFRFLVTGKIDRHMFYRLESSIQGLSAAREAGLDATLEIAGWIESEAEGRARQVSAQVGVSSYVFLSGPYTQQAAPDIYRRADAYVMTKHNDPCPNTVLEAMACGLPVLYARSGGVPELVADCGVGISCETGWDEIVVPNISDIADGMQLVATRHGELAKAARMRAEKHFEIKDWIECHRRTFDDVMTKAAEERKAD